MSPSKTQKRLKLTRLVRKVMESVTTSQTSLKMSMQGGLLSRDFTGAEEALDLGEDSNRNLRKQGTCHHVTSTH